MKEKKLLTMVLVGILCLGLMVVSLPSEEAYAKPKVIKLKFAHFFPPPARHSKICEEFRAELEKRFPGSVMI